ncbi:MAG: hypothetical protein JW751_08025 [Polyangiaceae bacterium]|nr:hypothetical protein [Polyangiaceae bacterium]
MPAQVLASVLALAVAGGCKRASESAPEGGVATAFTSVAAARPAPSAFAAARTAFAGTYLTERFVIEMTPEQGRIPAWDREDGKEGSGPGTLAITLDERGTVRGTAAGALGEQTVNGVLDRDTLRLTLAPVAGRSGRVFSGVIIAEREGNGYAGTLRASSGDSTLVRQGTVSVSPRNGP